VEEGQAPESEAAAGGTGMVVEEGISAQQMAEAEEQMAELMEAPAELKTPAEVELVCLEEVEHVLKVQTVSANLEAAVASCLLAEGVLSWMPRMMAVAHR